MAKMSVQLIYNSEMPDYEIPVLEALEAFYCAIHSPDLVHLRESLQSYDYNQYKNSMIRKMIDRITHSSRKYNKLIPVFECLTDLNVFDRDFLLFLKSLLLSVTIFGLQVLFQQCKIDVQIRQKYKLDVLPILFGNKTLYIEDLIELISERQFNINAKSIDGWTALHFAAHIESQCSIRQLLEFSANCNIKNDDGFTPLCYAVDDANCVLLLVQSGADIHITDNDDLTVIEKMPNDVTKLYTWEILLCQLAIDHYRNVQIKPSILEKVDESIFKKLYSKRLKEVELKLMDCEAYSSLTLLTMITTSANLISHHIQSQEAIYMIMEWCLDQNLNWCYHSLLQSNLEKAYNLYRMKCKIAKIISKSISRPINSDHLVIDRMCDFLSDKDVLVFANL